MSVSLLAVEPETQLLMKSYMAPTGRVTVNNESVRNFIVQKQLLSFKQNFGA